MKTALFSMPLMVTALCGSLCASDAPDFHFPFNIPKNFSLFTDQPPTHHPVSTSSVEAQQYFDQGLTLTYAFNHDAAYWSFKKAVEIDPNLAMGYWGMALVLGPNINIDVTATREKDAYTLIQKALSLAPQTTKSEQAYINALATRYSSKQDPDTEQLSKDYFIAMKKLIAQFPEDLDALTLTAEAGLNLSPWKQWDNQGNPRPGTWEIVDLLETVLKRDPSHLGANHYYIHAIEASNYPERALMSAERLSKLLPNSGHVLHMPSHIYLLTGDYHTAAKANEQAVIADRDYIAQYGMTGVYPLHYLSHNLYFLSRAYGMEGRFEDAKGASKELADFYNPHFAAMPELEYYAFTYPSVLLRFNRWQEVLDMPKPDPAMKGTIVLWHFSRGVAWAAMGDLEKAKAEQQLFEKERAALPEKEAFGNNTMSSITNIADLVLQSRIANTSGDKDKAIQLLSQAVDLQDKLGYNEPPDWFFPIRERLGGLLLRTQQYEKAEQIFRKDLEKHPRNGRSLFGLLMSLKAQNKDADAYWVNQQYEKAWQYSKTELSVEGL